MHRETLSLCLLPPASFGDSFNRNKPPLNFGGGSSAPTPPPPVAPPREDSVAAGGDAAAISARKKGLRKTLLEEMSQSQQTQGTLGSSTILGGAA